MFRRVVRWVWFQALFGKWRWYRKLHGGHWERWFIAHPVMADVWLPNEHGERPGLGLGRERCEEWP